MWDELDTERRAVMLGLFGSLFGGAAFAQSNAQILEDLARAALGRATQSQTGTTAAGSMRGGTGLTLTDADGGLRQALATGALASATRLSQLNGYWSDNKVQIPLPSPFNTLQSRLRPLRLSSSLDNFQLRLNRSAEATAGQAGSIFTDVISKITLADAIAIVRGGDTAGTDMLKTRAGPQLVSLLTPPMSNAVNTSGAGAALDRINARYGREIERLGGFRSLSGYGEPAATSAVPATTASAAPTGATHAGPLIFGAGATTPATSSSPAATTTAASATTPTAQPNSLKNQLIGFAVTKALDGLFFYIGEEEREIRRNPVKRTTDLLRRVFG